LVALHKDRMKRLRAWARGVTSSNGPANPQKASGAIMEFANSFPGVSRHDDATLANQRTPIAKIMSYQITKLLRKMPSQIGLPTGFPTIREWKPYWHSVVGSRGRNR